MRSIVELPVADLRAAGDAIETLIDFRAYLHPDGMLVMLAGRFRDDIRDVLDMKPLERAYRGQERNSVDELTSAELDTVAGAVGILLDRFTPFRDDPELSKLLRALRDELNAQKTERAQIRASIGAS